MLAYCLLMKNIGWFKDATEAMCHNAKLLVVFMNEVTLFSFRKPHHYMRDGMTCQKWLDNLENGSLSRKVDR